MSEENNQINQIENYDENGSQIVGTSMEEDNNENVTIENEQQNQKNHLRFNGSCTHYRCFYCM